MQAPLSLFFLSSPCVVIGHIINDFWIHEFMAALIAGVIYFVIVETYSKTSGVVPPIPPSLNNPIAITFWAYWY